MDRRIFLVDSVTLIAVAGCTPPSGAPDGGQVSADGETNQADVQALEAVWAGIADAANAMDLDGLMSHMHPDVTYLVPSAPPIEGWDAVRGNYARIYDRFRSTGQQLYLREVLHQFVVTGDWAWKFGESHAVITPIGEVPTIANSARPGSKHVGIYKKEQGQWLRYVQIRNGNTPEMNV